MFGIFKQTLSLLPQIYNCDPDHQHFDPHLTNYYTMVFCRFFIGPLVSQNDKAAEVSFDLGIGDLIPDIFKRPRKLVEPLDIIHQGFLYFQVSSNFFAVIFQRNYTSF